MSPTADQTLPGVYAEYSAERRTVVPPNPGAVVALPIVHNWGPVGAPELYSSLDGFELDFGTDTTPGRIAVYGAFFGVGLEGEGGAGAALVSRMAGASAAASEVTLKNPAAADAFTVSGAYVGTRADRLKVTVTPVTTGVQDVIVLDGTVEVESYTYRIADVGALAGLKTQMDGSDLVRGTVEAEGVTGLAPGTFALTGGDDGLVLTGADWLDGVAAFQDFDFAILAPFDMPYGEGVPNQAIRDAVNSLIAWRDQQEAEGHRFQLAFGGALDELPADAIARATAISNPAVITVGGPGFNDDTFGALSTSQMAPRIAGIRAFRGEGQSMDLARVAGGTPRPLATGARVSLSNVKDMVEAGVVVLTRDRYTVAPTRIAADVNTYQPDIGRQDPLLFPADRPKAIWGNPKFVLSMQQFANDAQAELEREMIGKTVVNDGTRNAAAARVLRMARDRERVGAFSPGTIVQAVPGSDTDNFIKLKVSLTFGRALTHLFIQSTVR